MIKVIKMDVFRMFKSKYTYIVLAAAMLMMFASVFMSQQDISYYQQTPSAMETLQETGDEVNWGIYIGQVSPEWCVDGAKIPLPELVSMNLQSKLLLMFLAAFIALFAGNEIRTGFIKNIAGQTRHRWELVIGKLFSIAVFTAVLLIAAVLAIMAGSVCFFGYVHMIFGDPISASHCLWKRNSVFCLPVSEYSGKFADRNFIGSRNFAGCRCSADKYDPPPERSGRLQHYELSVIWKRRSDFNGKRQFDGLKSGYHCGDYTDPDEQLVRADDAKERYMRKEVK